MTKWLVGTALALGCALAAPARAASFDCSQALTPDERAVCATPDLSALDSEMGGLWYAYSRVPMLMGGSGNRRDAAQAFVADRRQCGDNIACLERVYRERIGALRQAIDAAMAEFSRAECIH